MTISVIVPTYRRVAELTRCLAALQKQHRPAEQVLVTVRDTDVEIREFLAARHAGELEIEIVDVTEPGVIAAMNAALRVASGDVIALTDDDAAPWPDWLDRIENHFAADPRLGGVGGRDWQYKNGQLDDGSALHCGQLQWWGRVKGMHHHAVAGPPHEAVVIKGVDCAYRAGPLKEIGFDTRLAGSGAQVHWELGLGLAMRRAGWKILFDPSVAVDHFPAVRFDEDQRGTFNSLAQRNAVANETLLLLEHFSGVHRWVYLLWALFVGTGAAPGLLQLPRALSERKWNAGAFWLATQKGRFQGIAMFCKDKNSRARPGGRREILERTR